MPDAIIHQLEALRQPRLHIEKSGLATDRAEDETAIPTDNPAFRDETRRQPRKEEKVREMKITKVLLAPMDTLRGAQAAPNSGQTKRVRTSTVKFADEG